MLKNEIAGPPSTDVESWYIWNIYVLLCVYIECYFEITQRSFLIDFQLLVWVIISHQALSGLLAINFIWCLHRVVMKFDVILTKSDSMFSVCYIIIMMRHIWLYSNANEDLCNIYTIMMDDFMDEYSSMNISPRNIHVITVTACLN